MLRLGDVGGQVVQPGSAGGANFDHWFGQVDIKATTACVRQPADRCTTLVAQGAPSLIMPGVPRNYHLVPPESLTAPIRQDWG
jgi:hypothetical protein